MKIKYSIESKHSKGKVWCELEACSTYKGALESYKEYIEEVGFLNISFRIRKIWEKSKIIKLNKGIKL